MNKLNGELQIELNQITYNLKMSMGVIAAYESSTDSCFMADLYKVLNAASKTPEFKEDPVQYAEIMTQAITRKKAAYLTYYAAKETNSQVEFSEIQDAFITDHGLTTEEKFYPALFLRLALFAINGSEKEDKKKDSSKHG